jgi:hypothetical protein
MELTRRAFLQRIGLLLTALGMTEAGFAAVADRYGRVLAEPTRRKLALLVGINQYPESVSDFAPLKGSALTGCLTDVELQQQLLIHRFGFQPQDILTLTDQEATREGIETAFLAHLMEQVRSDDIVVVHFSGLGSRIRFSDKEEICNSLVPVDGVLPTEEHPAIADLMQETLGLLLRSLPTPNITTILDLCYTDVGIPLQGTLRIRSRPSAPIGEPLVAELALQQQLLEQVKARPFENSTSGLPGLVVQAAQPGQVALEGQWSGFSSGLLTHALTRYLWESVPPESVAIALGKTTNAVRKLSADQQHPQSDHSTKQGAAPFVASPVLTEAADGVITAVDGDGRLVQGWLGGLPIAALEGYGANALLRVGQGETATVLQVRSREGLRVQASLLNPGSPLSVGQPIQEWQRLIPRNLGLMVALDGTLERIERVDATSAFAASKVAIATTADQSADYLFGKMQPTVRTLTASLVSEGVSDSETVHPEIKKSGYGLFYPSRTVVAGTLLETEEAVKVAVNRVTPQLRILLAAKLLRLTENIGSSQLAVKVALETAEAQQQVLLSQKTRLFPDTRQKTTPNELPILTTGKRIHYRLWNEDSHPIYFLFVGFDGGRAIAYHPVSGTPSPTDPPLQENVLLPGESLVLPGSSGGWPVPTTAGLSENFLVFSRDPWQQAIATLNANRSTQMPPLLMALNKPLEVVQAILQDLHQASSNKNEAPMDAYALNINAWATFNFTYEVRQA